MHYGAGLIHKSVRLRGDYNDCSEREGFEIERLRKVIEILGDLCSDWQDVYTQMSGKRVCLFSFFFLAKIGKRFIIIFISRAKVSI